MNTHLNDGALAQTARSIPDTPVAEFVELNVALIDAGCELLSRIVDEQFTTPLPTIGEASIGAHFRHCVDFYESLLQGVSDGTIDYDNRPREPIVEGHRRVAMSRLEKVRTRLLELEADDDRPLEVRLTSAEGRTSTATTSLVRELETAANHTIHHYAIVAIHARSRRINVDRSFGVAISTLRYRVGQEQSQR